MSTYPSEPKFNPLTGSYDRYDPNIFIGAGQTVIGDPVTSPIVAPDSEPQQSNTDILAQLITESSIYKQAYQIFSSDKAYGAPFLHQLELIPTSYRLRDTTLGDDIVDWFGGSPDIEQLINDTFSQAMDEIRVLVQNYYTFKNGLPTEQVDQLRDAGINASITGEGVSPSTLPDSYGQAVAQANPSQTQYNNQQLSDGVMSFVSFLTSMVGLANTGFNAESLMGMLNIAERDSYNKQEVHDMIMASLGVTTDSPFRVLTPINTPVVGTESKSGVSKSKVASVLAGAEASAMDSPIEVSKGNNPNEVQTYEIRSGADWFAEMSRYKVANMFAETMINTLNLQNKQIFADTVSRLEGEYQVSNYGAMIKEAGFNADFFGSRNGTSEGKYQTSLAESLSLLKSCEANIQSIKQWKREYQQSVIEHWGTVLHERPSLAPYFYKALLDFDMSDTFFHQNGLTQGLHYGSQFLNSIGQFIGDLTGFKKPQLAPRKVGSTTVSTGPKGQTTTTTMNHYE